MVPGNMPMSSMGNQNFPVSSHSGQMGPMNPGLRPSGPPGAGHSSAGPGGPFPPSGQGMMSGGPNGIFPGRVKTEVPTVSPRGGGAGMSSFQHSPVPGNPTPPLTPNGPQNCISAPFASPVSDRGSGGSPSSSSQDTKPNFSLASKLASKLTLEAKCQRTTVFCSSYNLFTHIGIWFHLPTQRF